VGLLGIPQGGGTYVPLDLAIPQERLSFMLEDAASVIDDSAMGWESWSAQSTGGLPGHRLGGDQTERR